MACGIETVYRKPCFLRCDVPRPPRVLRGVVVVDVYHRQPSAGAKERPWGGPRPGNTRHLGWEWRQVSHLYKRCETPHRRRERSESAERERQSDGRRSRPRGACTGRSPNPDWFRTGSRWSGPSEDGRLPTDGERVCGKHG